MQVNQLLRQRYPGMEVLGTTYPVNPVKNLIATTIGYLQIALIAVIFTGDAIFQAFGFQQPPDMFRKLAENKLGACMAVWFIGNTLTNGLISTGAFEIYYDGKLLFSKLQEGRMPTVGEILNALDALRQPAAGTYESAAM